MVHVLLQQHGADALALGHKPVDLHIQKIQHLGIGGAERAVVADEHFRSLIVYYDVDPQ